MKKLEVNWTQEKVDAIALSRGGSDGVAATRSSAEILRVNEGAPRTRLIVISGRAELKVNVTKVRRPAV